MQHKQDLVAMYLKEVLGAELKFRLKQDEVDAYHAPQYIDAALKVLFDESSAR